MYVKRKAIRFLLVPVLLLALLLCLRPGPAASDTEGGEVIRTKEQLNRSGVKVGVSTGSAAMLIAEKELPNAEIVYLSDLSSACEALVQGKIDAYVYDRRQLELAIANGRKDVRLLDGNMDEAVHIAVGYSLVSPIPDLQVRLNDFIAEIKADGTLDDMYDRWVVRGDEHMPDIPAVQNPRFHLRVGTTGIVPPYSYYAGVNLKGYDIELAYRFAAWLGADVRFSVYDYGAIVPACVTGSVDCIMANLNITPERAEAIPFSDVLFTEQVGILVRGDAADGAGFPGGILDSFRRTFIREDRWQLFVQGILTTLILTVLSALSGTAFGFGIYLLCRNGRRTANAITRFFLWLVRGMPLVVLLMILYYIVFSGSGFSGVMVSVFAFTLTFGAGVFGMLKTGEEAVDKGQAEAAYALGYSNAGAFFRIILPQMLTHILPSYKGEIVSLIKATSVVGYIAVQDLTRMGDIVRSRTYEAFFPLIAITVIYFALEGLIGFLLSRIGIRLDPRRRGPQKVLKGVKSVDPS